jgi:simple sugar transport system ATP-binding protein
VVIAREVLAQPKLMLVGQPTRGVDIGTIESIHTQLLALRDAGVAILLVSVELEEVRRWPTASSSCAAAASPAN